MRTSLFVGLMLAGLAAGCSREAPATSQPPAADQPATAPDGTPVAPGSEAAPGSALAPAAPPASGAAPAARPSTPEAGGVPSASRGAAPAPPLAPAPPPPPPAPRFREVTLPAGTQLPLTLQTALASDTSSVEDRVQASLRRDVVVGGTTVLPAGTDLQGVVTGVQRSGKVKGRASLAFRFNTVSVDDEAYDIRTSSVSRTAQGTKKKDATKIGIGAGAGAVIGGIVGGGKGAAIGTAVGGGAGTGMVLATRGDEVRMAAGTPVTVRLSEPLTVRIPVN